MILRFTSILPSFVRSVITLSLGTFLSQLLGFLLLPLLSRLYNPQQFGLFYTFTGITQTLCLISTLKYEKSIILPEKKSDVNSLVLLTFTIVSIFSVILSIVLGLSRNINIGLGDVKNLTLLIPITIFSYSFYSIMLQWYQRDVKFKTISILGVCQSILVFGFSILFSYFKISQNGLVLGYVFGCFVLIILIIIFQYGRFYVIFNNLDKRAITHNFKKYIDFPKYYLFYDLLTSGFVFLTPVIISTYYSKIECGLFSMAYRILMVPIIIISIAVSNVFLVKAKNDFTLNKKFNFIYKNTLNRISILALLIYVPIFFFGGKTISIFLGEAWGEIDLYVKILSIMLFFEFIVYVFRNNTYVIVQKQRTGLIIQIFSMSVSLTCLILLSSLGLKVALVAFTLSSISFSCINLFVTYRLSKGFSNIINF